MKTCSNCKYSIFSELWGEYKCKLREIIVYDIIYADTCPSFAAKKPDKK